MKVLLNGEFIDREKASISPMDRGFLFGDGVYEVIPCQGNQPIGFAAHIARLNRNLETLKINYVADENTWNEYLQTLVQQVDSDSLGIYIHVSRGADNKRFHAYPDNITPTVFAYAFATKFNDYTQVSEGYNVITKEDMRWQRCNIKATSLLGNVMHFQEGNEQNRDEVILYNNQQIVTEATTCNVFMVQGDEISTPKLNHELLAGITREILLYSLKRENIGRVVERDIHLNELKRADEVWITSSMREVGAVTLLDDKPVGDGKLGKVWREASAAFNKYKFAL